MIDLHCHSTFSDGTFSPEALVKAAKAQGLSALALTDHDTIDGIREMLIAGKKYGLTIVSGVEISVDAKLPNDGHIHILGLFIDPESAHLKEKLAFLAKERAKRAKKIINRLNQLNFAVTLDELLAEAGEGAIGRPHIAKILIHKGYVKSIQEAFDLYLAKGKPAYIDKIKLDEAAAIALIHSAGGLAILAHPHLMNFDTFKAATERILSLKALGLDGFEVYYAGMPKVYRDNLLTLAKKYDFAISGGSDFHGDNKPGIALGTGKNNDLCIRERVLVQLQTKWQERHR